MLKTDNFIRESKFARFLILITRNAIPDSQIDMILIQKSNVPILLNRSRKNYWNYLLLKNSNDRHTIASKILNEIKSLMNLLEKTRINRI